MSDKKFKLLDTKNTLLGTGSYLIGEVAEKVSGRERTPLEKLIRNGISSSGPIGFGIDTYLDLGELTTSIEVKTHRQLTENILKNKPELSKKEADLDAGWILNDIEPFAYQTLREQYKKERLEKKKKENKNQTIEILEKEYSNPNQNYQDHEDDFDSNNLESQSNSLVDVWNE